MKVTPWFPDHIKPVHVGWYENKGASEFNWYWNGLGWGFFASEHFLPCYVQDRTWRGLAVKPK